MRTAGGISLRSTKFRFLMSVSWAKRTTLDRWSIDGSAKLFERQTRTDTLNYGVEYDEGDPRFLTADEVNHASHALNQIDAASLLRHFDPTAMETATKG